jgi:hypothetical protein
MPRLRCGMVRGRSSMTEVLIDRDQPYRTFLRNRVRITEQTRVWMGRFQRPGEYRFSYRRSSGGHVHWHIDAPELSEFELIQLQAHLGSDWRRIVLDLKRLAIGSHRINRAWDRRFVHGKMIRSGEWVPWFVVRVGSPTRLRELPLPATGRNVSVRAGVAGPENAVMTRRPGRVIRLGIVESTVEPAPAPVAGPSVGMDADVERTVENGNCGQISNRSFPSRESTRH